MAKQKFNILNHLGNGDNTSVPPAAKEEETSSLVSSMLEKLETPKVSSPLDCYKIIPRNKVRGNKKNDYPIIEIESLKESILQFGLIQDIVVSYITDEDMYVIEAGHRRRIAIDELIKEFTSDNAADPARYALYKKNIEKYERGYVCKISDTISENDRYDADNEEDLSSLPESAIDSEIRLILANNEVRSEDVRVKAKNVQRLAKLYARKNLELPKDRKININQQIGKDVNLKERQVAYYKNIDGLIPELQEEFYQKHISLKEGSCIAKLSAEDQEEILALIKENASKEKLNQTITALKKKLSDLEQPDIGSSASAKLLKADMKLKSSLEQTSQSIHILLKTIAAYRKLNATDDDIANLKISSEADIKKSKQILIELLS